MRFSSPMGCGHCTVSLIDWFTLYKPRAKYHEKTSIIFDKMLLVLCFFIYLVTIMHQCWSSFGLALMHAKKAAYVMASFLTFLRSHIVMFSGMKFCVGLVIVSGLMARLRRGLIIVCIWPRNMLKPVPGFRQFMHNHCKLGRLKRMRISRSIFQMG